MSMCVLPPASPVVLKPGTIAVLGVGLALLAGCATTNEGASSRDVSVDLEGRGVAGIRPGGARAVAELPPGLSLDGGLDDGKAVAIALWNNPAFQENIARLGLARADLAAAGLLANPTLSMLFPVGPKQLEFTATLPLETLWLRPKRVAIATLEAERVAKGLVQSGLDLARDVRVGLSDFRLALDRAANAGQLVATRERILDIAQNRLRLGDASELDALAARAELERTREEFERFTREQEIVRERLSLLLGWSLPAETTIAVRETLAVRELPALAALEARALAARPDLRASELALESAGRKAGLADAEVFSLSGILDANGSGKEGFEMGPGMALPLPILNRNQANRLRARAELERAGWNYLGTRQRIVAEVRDARLKLEQAATALALYEARVLPPFEELDRANRRAYELGEVSPLAVHDNQRQLLQLQTRRAELRADARRAWAELERSVGASLFPPVSSQPKSP